MNMNVSDFLEKWGRTLFEGPLATRTAPLESPRELAEIRFAILEEVRRHSYRAGARIVFPFDLVRVHLRGVEEARAGVFRSSFFRQYLEHEICANLRADSVRFPDQLRLEVDVSVGLPLPNEPWLTVAVASLQQPGARPPARLVVQSGSANAPELAIEKPRVYIGREVDVYRNGAIHRRNDLAFADESVSREHAHIDYDKATGEYRLFNDPLLPPAAPIPAPASSATSVSREVPRDTRGTRLEPGDEVHLGRAIVVFTV